MSRTTTLLAVLLTTLAPATSSALAAARPLPLAADASDPETRVRGINLAAGDCVWLSSSGTPGSHRGICLCATEIASDRTYAANNPVMYVDPDGLGIRQWGKAVGRIATLIRNKKVIEGIALGWDDAVEHLLAGGDLKAVNKETARDLMQECRARGRSGWDPPHENKGWHKESDAPQIPHYHTGKGHIFYNMSFFGAVEYVLDFDSSGSLDENDLIEFLNPDPLGTPIFPQTPTHIDPDTYGPQL